MKIILFSFVITIFLALSITAQSIIGNWKLSSIVIEKDMAFPIVAPISLNIDKKGKIGGNGGCNSFGGSYKLSKQNKVKFTDIISTQMFCDGASQTEQRFFQSLNEATKIYVKKGQLIIENSSKGNTLTFGKVNPTSAKAVSTKVFSSIATPRDTFKSHYAALAANDETLLRKTLSAGIIRTYEGLFPNEKIVEIMRTTLKAQGETTDLPEIVSEKIDGNKATIKWKANDGTIVDQTLIKEKDGWKMQMM